MRFAFSTNAYLKFSFDEAVHRLAAIGYTGRRDHGRRAARLARLSCSPSRNRPSAHALAESNLAIANINAFMMHAVNDRGNITGIRRGSNRTPTTAVSASTTRSAA